MKRAYIRPLTDIFIIKINTHILDSSILIDQGDQKTGSWEGETKQRDSDFGNLWW